MQRLRPLTAAALFCGMTAGPCRALDNVNVWIAGGLLGQMRGFCEVQDNSAIEERTSCPPGRVPYGGLLALSEVMGQAGWAGAYALLAGNNFPKDFAIPGGNDERHADFWSALRRAHAQVVALGQDDLLRAMLPARYDQQRPADSVERNVAFFQQGVKDYGFLASNAFIRTKRKGINSVQSHGYTLQVEPDETVAWTTKELSVLLPIHARKGGTYRMRIGGKEVAPSSVKEPVVTFPVMLDADTVYEIVITAAWSGKDAESATFRLKVDRPLTKWDNPGAGKLEGAPVALLSGRGARLLVVSLIDPGILTALDSTRWTYKSGGGTEELKLLPPDKVAEAILNRTADSAAVPVLLSDLGDTLNLKVLRQSDRWRITALNPDTAMLGCHSGKTGCSQGRTRPYAFGSVAVLDEGERARPGVGAAGMGRREHGPDQRGSGGRRDVGAHPGTFETGERLRAGPAAAQYHAGSDGADLRFGAPRGTGSGGAGAEAGGPSVVEDARGCRDRDDGGDAAKDRLGDGTGGPEDDRRRRGRRTASGGGGAGRRLLGQLSAVDGRLLAARRVRAGLREGLGPGGPSGEGRTTAGG